VISNAIAVGVDVGVAKLKLTDRVICPPAAEYVLAEGVTVTDWAKALAVRTRLASREKNGSFMGGGWWKHLGNASRSTMLKRGFPRLGR
jgi:hypothetical protein